MFHTVTPEVNRIVNHKLDAAIEKHAALALEREALAAKLRSFYRINGYVPDVLLHTGPIPTNA
jgi:hypothetical protein